MADFNQVLTPGKYQDGEITVVVEIPAGSNHKIEWDRKVGVMRLDRVDPAIFAKPTNYGFIRRVGCVVGDGHAADDRAGGRGANPRRDEVCR